MTTKAQRKARLQELWGRHNPLVIADELGVSEKTLCKYVRELGLDTEEDSTVEKTAEDYVREYVEKRDIDKERGKTQVLSAKVADLEKTLEMATSVIEYRENYKIQHTKSDSHTRAVAVALASDWHIEEVVKSYEVNGINKFNAAICNDRVRRFFTHIVKLIRINQHHTEIKTLVLALLGDFITGDIHEENVETARKLPMEAILEARKHISSGIHYILDNTDVSIVIPCATGNHSRTTKRVRMATEHGHSLEYFMYCSLEAEFRDNPHVTVMVNKGYHTYVQVWPNYTIRFHHGHAILYSGGVGGLSIPMNKAVAQWDKLRHVQLDACGHYHQFLDGGKWIVNGSLIGYNAFALRIKASPETAQQAFFLIDERVGKIMVTPIILTEDR